MARHELTRAGSRSFTLNCPICDAPMSKLEVPGVTADRCGECGALWLDPADFSAAQKDKSLAEALDRACSGPQRAADGRKLNCPRDGEPLTEFAHPEQAHVKLHKCKACFGILLDAGELRDLATFTLGERLRSLFGKG
jgi:Zn-finger nucleic acid-binding protein